MDFLKYADYVAKVENSRLKKDMNIRNHESSILQGYSESGLGDFFQYLLEAMKELFTNLNWIRNKDDEEIEENVKASVVRANKFRSEFISKFEDESVIIDLNKEEVKKAIGNNNKLMELISFIIENDTSLDDKGRNEYATYIANMINNGMDKKTLENNLTIWALQYGYQADFKMFYLDKDSITGPKLVKDINNLVNALTLTIASSIVYPILYSEKLMELDKINSENIKSGEKKEALEENIFSEKYNRQYNILNVLFKSNDVFKTLNELDDISNESKQMVDDFTKILNNKANIITDNQIRFIQEESHINDIIDFIRKCGDTTGKLVNSTNTLFQTIMNTDNKVKLRKEEITSGQVLDNGKYTAITTKGQNNDQEVKDIIDLVLQQDNTMKQFILKIGNIYKVLDIFIKKWIRNLPDTSNNQTNKQSLNKENRNLARNKEIANQAITQNRDNKNIFNTGNISNTSKNINQITNRNEYKTNQKNQFIQNTNDNIEFLKEKSRAQSFVYSLNDYLFPFSEDNEQDVVETSIIRDKDDNIIHKSVHGANQVDNQMIKTGNKTGINIDNLSEDEFRDRSKGDRAINQNIKRQLTSNSNLNKIYNELKNIWSSMIIGIKNINSNFMKFIDHNNKEFVKISSGNSDKVVSANFINKNPDLFAVSKNTIQNIDKTCDNFLNALNNSPNNLDETINSMNDAFNKLNKNTSLPLNSIFEDKSILNGLFNLVSSREILIKINNFFDGRKNNNEYFISLNDSRKNKENHISTKTLSQKLAKTISAIENKYLNKIFNEKNNFKYDIFYEKLIRDENYGKIMTEIKNNNKLDNMMNILIGSNNQGGRN